MHETILILDFGSPYTQLIARKIRSFNVYCEIHPYNKIPELTESYKGIILSGSSVSLHDSKAPHINLDHLVSHAPILGIGYGAQYLAQKLAGAEIAQNSERSYEWVKLQDADWQHPLFNDVDLEQEVFLSTSDAISKLSSHFTPIAHSPFGIAAFDQGRHIFGLQFHPEMAKNDNGFQILKNFVVGVCGCLANWTPAHFVDITIQSLKEKLGSDRVVLGLSGGVDSSVAALLLHKAIGKNLYCVFVDNGLLRKNEFNDVLHSYRDLGLNVNAIDAKEKFYNALAGLSDPEQKRKAIGAVFIDVFDAAAHDVQDVKWLAQGTIYPDVIESVNVNQPGVAIKSHHNVGGLPDFMKLKIVEPLRNLFKDEVRKVGAELGLPQAILGRHPFPGPGLGIRILGDITPKKVHILQEVDHIYVSHLKAAGLYDKIWQAGAILLPVQSVGVTNGKRTYENAVALRAVISTDGMTARWYHMPYDLLEKISNDIINRVDGVNRVVYDVSSKPPATIEWE